MRRSVATLIVLVLFVVGSSVASAASRQTVTIRALVAQAEWERFDEDTGSGEFGVVQFATAEGTTTAFLAVSRGELIQCEGALTPDDPSDDTYGFLGTLIQGEGPATLALGKSYSSATGSGTVGAQIQTFDECTGEGDVTTTRSISLALDLTGISPVITQKSRTTITIPKTLRAKVMLQSRSRDAAGTLVMDGQSSDVGGAIGNLWMKGSQTQR
jgi:hypothetical protein